VIPVFKFQRERRGIKHLMLFVSFESSEPTTYINHFLKQLTLTVLRDESEIKSKFSTSAFQFCDAISYNNDYRF